MSSAAAALAPKVEALWRHRYPEDASHDARQPLLDSQMRLLDAASALVVAKKQPSTAAQLRAQRYGATAGAGAGGGSSSSGGGGGGGSSGTGAGVLTPEEEASLSRLVRHRLPLRSPLPTRPVILSRHVLHRTDVQARVATLREAADQALAGARADTPAASDGQLVVTQRAAAKRLPHKVRVALREVRCRGWQRCVGWRQQARRRCVACSRCAVLCCVILRCGVFMWLSPGRGARGWTRPPTPARQVGNPRPGWQRSLSPRGLSTVNPLGRRLHARRRARHVVGAAKRPLRRRCTWV